MCRGEKDWFEGSIGKMEGWVAGAKGQMKSLGVFAVQSLDVVP